MFEFGQRFRRHQLIEERSVLSQEALLVAIGVLCGVVVVALLFFRIGFDSHVDDTTAGCQFGRVNDVMLRRIRLRGGVSLFECFHWNPEEASQVSLQTDNARHMAQVFLQSDLASFGKSTYTL